MVIRIIGSLAPIFGVIELGLGGGLFNYLSNQKYGAWGGPHGDHYRNQRHNRPQQRMGDLPTRSLSRSLSLSSLLSVPLSTASPPSCSGSQQPVPATTEPLRRSLTTAPRPWIGGLDDHVSRDCTPTFRTILEAVVLVLVLRNHGACGKSAVKGRAERKTSLIQRFFPIIEKRRYIRLVFRYSNFENDGHRP